VHQVGLEQDLGGLVEAVPGLRTAPAAVRAQSLGESDTDEVLEDFRDVEEEAVETHVTVLVLDGRAVQDQLRNGRALDSGS
jgi:hypothetical protein